MVDDDLTIKRFLFKPIIISVQKPLTGNTWVSDPLMSKPQRQTKISSIDSKQYTEKIIYLFIY